MIGPEEGVAEGGWKWEVPVDGKCPGGWSPGVFSALVSILTAVGGANPLPVGGVPISIAVEGRFLCDGLRNEEGLTPNPSACIDAKPPI